MSILKVFAGVTRMDTSSKLTNQHAAEITNQNIELAIYQSHTTRKQTQYFSVETLFREKNHEQEIKSSRTVTRYTHKLIYLSLYLDLRTVVVLVKNTLTRHLPCTIFLTRSPHTLSNKMINLLQESRSNKHLLEQPFRMISQ